MTANWIPRRFHRTTPHLITRDAAGAIDFYREAFGAEEKFRLVFPDGTIAHAEVLIGDSRVMISDEHPAGGSLGPEKLGGSAVLVHLYVENVDAVSARAVDLGAKVLIPVADQFHGDRAGRIKDPFGHIWVIATDKVEMEPAEMQRRFEEFLRRGEADPEKRPG